MRSEQEQSLISKIVVIAAFAFFASFAAGIEKLANDKDHKMTALQVLSVLLMHGVSGTIFGMVASAYIGDTMIVYALSGMGGLMGSKVIYGLYKGLIKSLPGGSNSTMEGINDNKNN